MRIKPQNIPIHLKDYWRFGLRSLASATYDKNWTLPVQLNNVIFSFSLCKLTADFHNTDKQQNLSLALRGYHYCCWAGLKCSIDTKFPKQSNTLGQSCGMLHVKSGPLYGSTEEGHLLWALLNVLCQLKFLSLSLVLFLFSRVHVFSGCFMSVEFSLMAI